MWHLWHVFTPLLFFMSEERIYMDLPVTTKKMLLTSLERTMASRDSRLVLSDLPTH